MWLGGKGMNEGCRDVETREKESSEEEKQSFGVHVRGGMFRVGALNKGINNPKRYPKRL